MNVRTRSLALLAACAIAGLSASQASLAAGEEAATTQAGKLVKADQQATLKVTALNKNMSQLMIVGSAPAGDNPQTTRIVNAALRLCGDLGKTCQVGSN